jgi:hypothetical protein
VVRDGTVDERTYTITQKRFLRGRQTLTLEGDMLKVECRRGLSLQEYRFELRGFLPEPLRIRRMPLTTVIGMTLTGALGLFLILLGLIAETSLNTSHDVHAFSGPGLVLLVIGGLGWIRTSKELTNVVVFEGPGGRMVLWLNRPNQEEFNKFLAVLTVRIRNAQSREQRLLRLLRQAGIIDAWQYDQAMELFQERGDRPDSN